MEDRGCLSHKHDNSLFVKMTLSLFLGLTLLKLINQLSCYKHLKYSGAVPLLCQAWLYICPLTCVLLEEASRALVEEPLVPAFVYQWG